MTNRRLAAILAADVVGFSALMGRDEEGTLYRIKWLRREVIDPKVQAHHGRVFKATGDGLLAEFPSPVEAVRCAVEVQDALASVPLKSPPSRCKYASASI
jgi:adenylate cyclase